jgi:hypothetical protein
MADHDSGKCDFCDLHAMVNDLAPEQKEPAIAFIRGYLSALKADAGTEVSA